MFYKFKLTSHKGRHYQQFTSNEITILLFAERVIIASYLNFFINREQLHIRITNNLVYLLIRIEYSHIKSENTKKKKNTK